jgi:hypothetical protein
MKKIVLLVLVFTMVSVARGKVSTRVCLADGYTPLPLADPNIPFVYQDIMVGTKLTIIVDSDIAERWSGGLHIAGTDRVYGVLSARDFNDTPHDWEGSHLEAAGDRARVIGWQSDIKSGFDLYSHRKTVAGDWFIIDYTATRVGTCNVGFYEYTQPGGMDYPVYDLVFSHVPTRDFNEDTKVDVADFAIFASYWQVVDCNDPNQCGGTDLDTDGNVDSMDLTLFMDYWLNSTE